MCLACILRYKYGRKYDFLEPWRKNSDNKRYRDRFAQWLAR